MPNTYRARTVFGVLVILLFSTSLVRGEDHQIREYETAMTKGTFSLEMNDYASAVSFFMQSLAIKPNDVAATNGLGIAYLKSGAYLEAKATFLKALAIDPTDMRIRYELGVVLYKLGIPEEAKDFFTAVAEGPAEGTLKSSARQYLGVIAGKSAQEKKGLSLDILGGLQYDTNVILEPSNPAAASQRKSDWRAVLMLDGNYRFIKSDKTSADAGYQFYQSIHHYLHEFNVQEHTFKLAAVQDLSNTVKAGAKYAFNYALAGGSHFSTSNEIMPYLSVNFSPQSHTEFHIIYRKDRFFNSSLFPLNAEQNGSDTTGGITHRVRIGTSSSVSISYNYDIDDANKRFWSYEGNKGTVGFQTSLESYAAAVSASYYDQRYHDVFEGYTDKRHDGVQEYSVNLSRNIAKNLGLTLSDLYTVHDSNLPTYAYTRNILGLFVVTRL